MLLNTDTGREATGDPSHRTYAFGDFVLDIDRGAVLKNGFDVRLRPKSFEVLTYFVGHPGVLLRKRELLAAVWGDVVVTEDSLTQCLIEIRKALGDRSRNMIRTVPRRGYIFDIPVTAREPASPAETAHRFGPFFSHRRPSVWSVGAIMILAIAVAAGWWSDLRGRSFGQAGETSVQSSDSESLAVEHYLRGMFFHGRRSAGDPERAITEFQQALEIDPGLADAWVGLAGAKYVQAHERDEFIGDDVLTAYKSTLYRAIGLAPGNAVAHARLFGYYRCRLDWDKAQEHLKLAMDYGQSSPMVLSIVAGAAYSESRLGEAIDLQQRATALEPLSFVNRVNLAHMLYSADRPDEARVEFERALDLNPAAFDQITEELVGIHILQRQYDAAEILAQQLPDGLALDRTMALVHHAYERRAESGRILDRLAATPGVEPAVTLAEIFANLVMFDESFHWLNLATERQFNEIDARFRSTILEDIRNSPFLKPLRSDPRWVAWLEETEDRTTKTFFPEPRLAALHE